MPQVFLDILLAVLIIRERCNNLMNGFRMKPLVLHICCGRVGRKDLFVLLVGRQKDGSPRDDRFVAPDANDRLL